MFYWVIPYLVAYTASNSSDWEYGPLYTFRADVHGVEINYIMDSRADWNIYINFVCRPMDRPSIQCRIDATELDMGLTLPNASSRQSVIGNEQLCLKNIVFEIKYDTRGITRVLFLNNNQIKIHKIIQAIVNGMHVGICTKEVGNYTTWEYSFIGTCNTNFVIENKLARQDGEHQLDNFEFSLGSAANSKPIVITKDRNLSECAEETPYFIGLYNELDAVTHLNVDTNVLNSRSQINLDKNSFSAYTENFGTSVDEVADGSGQKIKTDVVETISITLKSIERETEYMWDIGLVDATSC